MYEILKHQHDKSAPAFKSDAEDVELLGGPSI